MSEETLIDEKMLLLQLQQGNQQAFKTLYDLYATRLTVKLLQLVKSEEVAQDLLQDIFMKIWQMREDLDIEKSFGALLYTMATRLSYNTFRSAIREQARIEAIQPRETYSHIEESIHYNETNKLLEDAISLLTERQKEVFVLHKLEGKSYKEISEILKISPSAINQHLQLANKRIRSFMTSRLSLILFILASLFIESPSNF